MTNKKKDGYDLLYDQIKESSALKQTFPWGTFIVDFDCRMSDEEPYVRERCIVEIDCNYNVTYSWDWCEGETDVKLVSIVRTDELVIKEGTGFYRRLS